MAELRSSRIQNAGGCADVAGYAEATEIRRRKRKTRPGGQPDGSSHMGAWGGWALAPYTASMGRDYRSHIDWSRKGGRTFKPIDGFFNILAGIFASILRAFAADMAALRVKKTAPNPQS
jgi:hypothetical protein